MKLLKTALILVMFVVGCFPVQEVAAARPKEKDRMSLAELKQKYPDYLIFRGPSNQKVAALTFDDAPDPRFTGQILDVLKAKKVKATFFLVGYRAQTYKDLVKRVEREGHAIGNHSYNHAHLPELSPASFVKQLTKTQIILRSIIGYEPRLFRPPYGAVNEWQLKWAVDHDYAVVNWNVDSLDWKGLKQEQVKKNILAQVVPGSIILQHAGGGRGEDLTGTIKALPRVIDALRAKGYTFVTVPEMLGVTTSME